jgi:osmoprotectant transport system permease protein
MRAWWAGRIEPVDILPVLVSLVPASGLLLLDIIRLRPNRIADGEGYRVWAFLPGSVTVVVALLGAMVIVAVAVVVTARRHSAGEMPALLLWALLATVTPWVLFAAGARGLAAAGHLGDLARISPGPALWLGLVSALAAWHELFRSSSREVRWVLGSTLLIALAGITVLIGTPPLDRISYLVEYHVRADRFHREVIGHIRLSGAAVLAATLIGIPAGIAAFRRPRLRETILGVTSTIQTIPSLAMFGLLIAPLAALSRALPFLRRLGVSGVGATPALIALTVYALLPIVRNTLTGLATVPVDVRESGRAMGMTRRQRFWMVEVPLAFPVILRGVRTAAVQAVGNTTVAGLIGAGGLGWFVFQGLGQAATDLVVLGVIPIVLLAVGVDRLFQVVQQITTPGPVRENGGGRG